MQLPNFDSACRICRALAGDPPMEVIWEDDLWFVRHTPPPAGVAGWLTIYSKRHVPGSAWFDDREAVALGPTLRWLARHLLEATVALRVYIAATVESAPHFHAHLVPRYEHTPGGVSGFALFELSARAVRGEVAVDPDEIARIVADLTTRLGATRP